MEWKGGGRQVQDRNDKQDTVRQTGRGKEKVRLTGRGKEKVRQTGRGKER